MLFIFKTLTIYFIAIINRGNLGSIRLYSLIKHECKYGQNPTILISKLIYFLNVKEITHTLVDIVEFTDLSKYFIQ